MPRLVARVVLLVVVSWWSLASAETYKRVQPPSRKARTDQAAASKVKKARAQGLTPYQVSDLARTLDRRAVQLGEKGLGSRKFRSKLSQAPLPARLQVFIKAAARRGISIQSFDRRLRGMASAGKKTRVVKTTKTFFEVTPESFDLFPEIMGENVVWFAANESPGHLHTLVSDQNGGEHFTHNTYGTANLDTAGVDNNYVQYMAPAFLTGPEMDRWVRYLNAGVAHGQPKVYGFKTSSGKIITSTACTNWATSAPIGELKRWVRTTDRRIAQAAAEGRLDPKFRGGLHAVLAGAATAEARQAILAEVLAADGLTPHTRASVKRLGKEFAFIAEKWPERPLDLVGRESMSHVMGVPRSQDPAKWMYDLFFSKRVPVIGVLSKTRQEGFAGKEFNLEIMGKIDASGNVVEGPSGKRGVVPPERRPGYVPPAPEPPAAAPAEEPAESAPPTESASPAQP
jgi:hypothetical protein